MRNGGRFGGALLIAFAITAPIRAQDRSFVRQVGYYDEIVDGDRVEAVLTGGVVFEAQDVEARAERGLLVFDRDRRVRAIRGARRESGLPREGFQPAPSRRALTPQVMRERLERFLGSMRRKPARADTPPEMDFELLRSFYLEGGVELVHRGRKVARAERMFYSVIDDRAVFESVELRLFRVDSSGAEQVVVVRTDELVRQGARMVGRDISVTTCSAGEPHWEVFSGEAEIIERGDEFEIRSRDNWLAFSGHRLVPLPDAKQFTGSRANYWIQSARAGYSSRQGAEVQVDVGGPLNRVGGWLHKALTGRPAEEFRGDWRLGLGWIEKRGFPIDGELTYGAADSYEGEMRGFWLDDKGENIREIKDYIDGTPIDVRNRHLFDTRNRVFFGDKTKLDLQAFYAGDPAVLSEFYPHEFLHFEEVPETSVHLQHSNDNRYLSAIGRWNIAKEGFSYDSSRALSPRFVEEEPNVEFDWISQPIAELPGETPLMLTSSTSLGRFRSRYDDRFAGPVFDDDTTRFDQELELSTPFHAGPIGVRLFASGRYTHFSDSAAGGSQDRFALSAGASVGTRMARTWKWLEGDAQHALRHVVSPTVRFEHQFRVDGDPSDYWQFDEIDALDERANIRVGLLQRFQKRTRAPDGDASEIRELLWVDLAQNFLPIADRDNGGNDLGLFEFEIILRPTPNHFVVDNLTFLVEGEEDWNASELRTLNTYVRFEALSVTWYGGYREDFSARGTVGFGAEMPVRERWLVGGQGAWDLEQDEFLSWTLALVRRDHDWQISMSLRRDEIIDETSFSVDFVPEFGGLFRLRGPRAGIGDTFGGFRFTEW